jgi:hypothetical protein
MVDEDDFEDSASLSDEELSADLRKRGGDPDRLRASIDQLLVEAGALPAVAAPAAPVKVVSIATAREARTRRLWPLLVAAALVLVVLGGGGATIAYLSREPAPPGPPPVPTGPPAPNPDMIAAETLRKDAFDLCQKKNFGPCLDKLDEAAKLDPQGDKKDAVQQARIVANSGLNPDGGVDAGQGFVKLPYSPRQHP